MGELLFIYKDNWNMYLEERWKGGDIHGWKSKQEEIMALNVRDEEEVGNRVI